MASSTIRHIGIARRSGRYPWGSGDDPQRSKSFLQYVKMLENQGMTQVEVANGVGMNTDQLRKAKAIAKTEERINSSAMAERLKAKGMSNVAIGNRMGLNESTVRSLLDPAKRERDAVLSGLADNLKTAVGTDGVIDIGIGVEAHLGVARTKLNTAVAILKEQGYETHILMETQVGTGKMTSIKVLVPPGMTLREASLKRDQLHMPGFYSEDGGKTLLGLEPIRDVDSSRIDVRYGKEGALRDGLIELRPGIDDISLGSSTYAQVRIGVDGTHFLKGMAIHNPDLPSGVDIRFNTNKNDSGNKLDALKNVKDDTDNPFGSTVRQKHYIDADGKTQLSSLNIIYEEGDWANWSKSISSQVLAKQAPVLAQKQLDLALDIKKAGFEDLMTLTNPEVKAKLLYTFGDECDSAAVHLKAAALPRQSSHVILPIVGMKEDEVYAPNYIDGERVVLIRHPHAGIFEIPELRVNNRNKEAKALLKGAVDAVGIHPETAKKLSGADFDGDTVLVIPNRGDIKTAPSLLGLKDFEPKAAYPPYEGMTKMTPKRKQLEMGNVSNLITDMTIKGASHDELARAVRHSMVVIDAEKHSLDYRRSALDNNITGLKRKYQGGPTSGAATLLSRAGSQARVPKRRDGYKIDEATGKKIFTYMKDGYIDKKTGMRVFTNLKDSYVDRKTGKTIQKTTKTTKMYEESDALKLSSGTGTRIETIYGRYANELKSLGDRARAAIFNTPPRIYSPAARGVYSKEVASLKAKLAIAYKNKPLERHAQLLANKTIGAKRAENPNMEPDQLKKVKYQALSEARRRSGTFKHDIEITKEEWTAIQNGAVTKNLLISILDNTDLDKVREYALPKKRKTISSSQKSRAKSMAQNKYTRAEISQALGIPLSVLSTILSE